MFCFSLRPLLNGWENNMWIYMSCISYNTVAKSTWKTMDFMHGFDGKALFHIFSGTSKSMIIFPPVPSLHGNFISLSNTSSTGRLIFAIPGSRFSLPLQASSLFHINQATKADRALVVCDLASFYWPQIFGDSSSAVEPHLCNASLYWIYGDG